MWDIILWHEVVMIVSVKSVTTQKLAASGHFISLRGGVRVYFALRCPAYAASRNHLDRRD